MSLPHKFLTGVYFPLRISYGPKEGRACLINHRQWHLLYDTFENKKFYVKKLTKNIGRVFTIVINLTLSNAWFEGVSLRPCFSLFYCFWMKFDLPGHISYFMKNDISLLCLWRMLYPKWNLEKLVKMIWKFHYIEWLSLFLCYRTPSWPLDSFDEN